ncbi:MAG: hypothetical protein IJ645_08990 [Ruminococcus sp.]|nr:hypothetical protein [Ruminococcus sp.]
MLLKKLLALPISLCIAVSALSFTVFAELDMDYEGEINIYTGEPVDSQETDVNQSVTLPDGSVFDREDHTFRYTASEGYVYSTVANGMITTESVSLSVSGGVNAVLYKDGEIAEDTDISDITEPGSYVLVGSDNDTENQLIAFTIVSKNTGAINTYLMPVGFEVIEVVISDVTQSVIDKGKVDMSVEGEYIISYRCSSTGIDYGLNVTVDHQAPKITLEGVKDGKASGPVTVKGIAKTDSVYLQFGEDKETFPSDGVLKTPGEYQLTVTDAAGNSVTESFEIRMYLNAQGIWFALLAAAVFISAGVYMYLARKRLRVR